MDLNRFEPLRSWIITCLLGCCRGRKNLGSSSATSSLAAGVMPGGAPPLASLAPSVGPFEQEVTSLENRRIELSQRPIIFYGSSSIRRWKTLSQDFIGYPVVNCGFGGSRLSDCVRYVSRLVLRLKPAVLRRDVSSFLSSELNP